MIGVCLRDHSIKLATLNQTQDFLFGLHPMLSRPTLWATFGEPDFMGTGTNRFFN